MAEPFDDLKSGDAITPRALNVAYRALRRLRMMRAAAPLHLSGADGNAPPTIGLDAGRPFWIQLTGPAVSGAYPWAEVTLATGRVVALSGVTGSVAGDPAYERRKGDLTLTSGSKVYRAVRSPASGEVLFAARTAGGGAITTCAGCLAAIFPCTLTDSLYGAITFGSSPSYNTGAVYSGTANAFGGTFYACTGPVIPITTTLKYELFCTGSTFTFKVSYACCAFSLSPIAKSPDDAFVVVHFNNIQFPVTTLDCLLSSPQVFTIAADIRPLSPYASGATVTLSKP